MELESRSEHRYGHGNVAMQIYSTKSTPTRPRALILLTSDAWAGRLQALSENWEICATQSLAEFRSKIENESFDVVGYSAELDFKFGTELMTEVPSECSHSLTLCAGDYSGLPRLLDPSRAFDEWNQSDLRFVTLPLSESAGALDRWFMATQECSRLRRENQALRQNLALRGSAIRGQCAAIERLRQQVATASHYDWPVLIQGESGTGRSMIARAIHESSSRSHRPLIEVNCRVYTSTAFERELFGQVCPQTRDVLYTGRLDQAQGGTVVLDGIEFLAAPLQQILANVLERREFYRAGETNPTRLTARVIAISTENLSSLVAKNQFRRDLLCHFEAPVLTPPILRDVRPDIAMLTEVLLDKICRRLGIVPRRMTLEAIAELQSHDWPENHRELEMVLERTCEATQGTLLTPQDVQPWIARKSPVETMSIPTAQPTLSQMERLLIETTFARCGGNRELTARTLDIGIRTLSGKLREYGYPPRGGPGSNRQPLTVDIPDRDAA